MNQIYFHVVGLTNTEDKTKIKNALDKVDGIAKTAVDVARGTIEIGYNDPADKTLIVECIEDSGFKVLT